MPTTDILVIGSGIAGLSFAVKCALESPERSVTLLTKCDASESNTKYAQGGMAVVVDDDRDSYEKHIADTLTAGAGHCDAEIVRLVVEEGPKRLQEIIDWGVNFDLEHGRMRLGREGGHSVNRIVHNRDVTGFEMEKALLSKISELKNVRLLAHRFAVELLLNADGKCCGATAIDRKSDTLNTFYADVTVISSGGMSRVFRMTTNPEIATGDGVAMAFRAGAKVADMEFIQFHPTGMYSPLAQPTFLISEAVRGDGAVLTDRSGIPFMRHYHKDADLAPRDIVARAIWQEMQHSGAQHVFLDCTSIDETEFLGHFPNIYAKCLRSGIDPAKKPIPVAPAAHYVCGGIATDSNGRTSINGLYAIGECARTGLHGANRLASNSLLEALVFAHRAAMQITSYREAKKEPNNEDPSTPIFTDELTTQQAEILSRLKTDLQDLMSEKVGIIRTTEGLQQAQERIAQAEKTVAENFSKNTVNCSLLELRNMLTVTMIIVNQSLKRKENLGGFFNKDLK